MKFEQLGHKRSRLWLLSCLGVIGALTLALVVWRHAIGGMHSTKGLSNDTTRQAPVLITEQIYTLFSQEGRARIRLEAARQEEFINGDMRFPEGIYLIHYDELGAVKAILQADSGFYFQKQDLYVAHGDVEVYNHAEDHTLRSSKLNWLPQTKRIFTDRPIRIETDTEIHLGKGLEAHEDFSNYRILEPSGTLSMERKTTSQATSPMTFFARPAPLWPIVCAGALSC